MLRRTLLKYFLSVPAAFLGIQAPYTLWDVKEDGRLVIPYTEDKPFSYRGWNVFWTGWKTDYRSNILAGQWIAWPPVEKLGKNRRFFVSCVPGECREYFPGEVFDISDPEGGITAETPRAFAEKKIILGLGRIKKLLDTVPKCE